MWHLSLGFCADFLWTVCGRDLSSLPSSNAHASALPRLFAHDDLVFAALSLFRRAAPPGPPGSCLACLVVYLLPSLLCCRGSLLGVLPSCGDSSPVTARVSRLLARVFSLLLRLVLLLVWLLRCFVLGLCFCCFAAPFVQPLRVSVSRSLWLSLTSATSASLSQLRLFVPSRVKSFLFWSPRVLRRVSVPLPPSSLYAFSTSNVSFSFPTVFWPLQTWRFLF